MDPGGVPILDRTSRAEPKVRDFGVTDEHGLEKSVPAGTYKLAMTVLNERTHAVARTERPFEVLWAVSSWGREADAVLQEMILVMTDAEYDRLEKLKPGAREVYLAEFWHGLDPDPATPDNPTLDTFRARVEYADRQFATPLRRGILSDRGRVYVRYGAPDDESYQFSASSFGGGAGVEGVAEPGERVNLGTRPSTSFLDADEFREGDVSDLAAQRGGATVKSQQVVVWTYDGRGAALRPGHQDLSGSSHKGLKFVFSDAMGNGDYQLIGSSGTTIY
jgi:GWxTD domain-containing protein